MLISHVSGTQVDKCLQCIICLMVNTFFMHISVGSWQGMMLMNGDLVVNHQESVLADQQPWDFGRAAAD